jgi:diphthine-ammonia ligase
MTALHNKPVFSSWSGGKDSCLALYRAIRQGALPRFLFTMFAEDGTTSRSHGLPPSVIRAQAEALGLPSVTGKATWNDYEKVFLNYLANFKKQGVVDGVFGDIDLEPHRQWVERVCAEHDVRPHLPLWQQSRGSLLGEFLEAGFEAMIVVVKDERLDRSFLGRRLDLQTIGDLEAAGVDACGEEGEFHTVVTNGPLFSIPLNLRHGDIISNAGYSFLRVEL